MIELNWMTSIEEKLDALISKMGNHERRMHSANEVVTVDENEKRLGRIFNNTMLHLGSNNNNNKEVRG